MMLNSLKYWLSTLSGNPVIKTSMLQLPILLWWSL